MEEIKKWYAVYTRAKWEKKVSDLFTKRRIENFCPLRKVVRQWADRKKMLEEPLFSCYVFVCITDAEMLAVKQTDGVLNFVYWLQKPARIKDAEISSLKNFVNNYTNIHLEKIDVNINDQIRILNGPLVSREGNILEVNKNRVKVLLPTLGYALTAEVAKTNIEIININTSQYSLRHVDNKLIRQK